MSRAQLQGPMEAEAGESEPLTADAHPFSGFVRCVGRGASLSRALTIDEAAEAMRMILAGEAAPVQVGALLLVLRYRKETPEELAGFVKAAHGFMKCPQGAVADLDWPSYADRHRQLPYFVLSALLLVQSGIRVLMHGIAGQGPVTTPAVLAALGIQPSPTVGAAADALAARGFAYLPLAVCCPQVEQLFTLRRLLGVRSAANTFARELNPFGAPYQLQGVFHPTYLPTHQETARLLGQPHAAIFKGGGGEVQRNPGKPCALATVEQGVAGEEVWPALLPGERHGWRHDPLDPQRVVALWRGELEAPSPEAAVIGTAAIGLKLAGRAKSHADAEDMARGLWADRDRTAW